MKGISSVVVLLVGFTGAAAAGEKPVRGNEKDGLSFEVKVKEVLSPAAVTEAELFFKTADVGKAPVMERPVRLFCANISFTLDRMDKPGRRYTIVYRFNWDDRDRVDYTGARPLIYDIMTPRTPGKYRITVTVEQDAKTLADILQKFRLADPGPWFSGRMWTQAFVTVVEGPAKGDVQKPEARAPIDETAAVLLADAFLKKHNLDWGKPVKIEPVGEAAFLLRYETPAGENVRLGLRSLVVNRTTKVVSFMPRS